MGDEEDECSFRGTYENGHWAWDDLINSLAYKLGAMVAITRCQAPHILDYIIMKLYSDLPPQIEETAVNAKVILTGTVEFRDDIDLIEQLRFRKRYQRKLKLGQADVITIQDVKDLAIFTAPLSILSPMLINFLHLSTTERFLRGLILYCQYYLQISDEMTNRIKELDTKVRTPDSDAVEEKFRANLSDLRTVVAKEYALAIIGGADTAKFHHMGPEKKSRSLSNTDARLFETFLQMSIQIVWLALGRRCFNQLELELNRLFKSEIFNSAEHTLKTGYLEKMSRDQRSVLLGRCLRRDKKLTTRSPLANEVFCTRPIDYRMMGLGVIKAPDLTPRLKYLLKAISAPEEDLIPSEVTVGILGHPRSCFDTMLHLVSILEDPKAKNSATSVASNPSGGVAGVTSTSSKSEKKSLTKWYIYNDIVLPEKLPTESDFPMSFPTENEPIRVCSQTQRRRWRSRLHRLLHPPKNRRKSNV